MTTYWFDALEDRLGIRMSEEKSHRWERILNATPAEDGYDAKTTNQELANAVIFVAQKKAHQSEKSFTLEVLFGWLKWYRKERAISRRGASIEDIQHNKEAYIARLKAVIDVCDTHTERWNILCSPKHYVGEEYRDTTLAEAKELEYYCFRKYADFKRPDLHFNIGQVFKKPEYETAGV